MDTCQNEVSSDSDELKTNAITKGFEAYMTEMRWALKSRCPSTGERFVETDKAARQKALSAFQNIYSREDDTEMQLRAKMEVQSWHFKQASRQTSETQFYRRIGSLVGCILSLIIGYTKGYSKSRNFVMVALLGFISGRWIGGVFAAS